MLNKVQEEMVKMAESLRGASELTSVKLVEEWAKPFIVNLGAVCLPDQHLSFSTRRNPQEIEESKDEIPFR